jgi:hypothetical protein
MITIGYNDDQVCQELCVNSALKLDDLFIYAKELTPISF